MAPRTLSSRISAGLSASPSTRAAAGEAARGAASSLSERPDLAFLFLSAEHREAAVEAAEVVLDELRPRHLVGCVAGGVVAGDREIEEGPAVGVWAAELPGAEVELFHAVARETGEGVAVAGFPELDDAAAVALLVDPFTFPTAPFLDRLNAERPGLPLVGGIAVGGDGPGEGALILDGEVVHEGGVGAAISGAPVLALVSQGCREFGREAVITAAEGNVVLELAGERALDRLRADIAALSPAEQALAARGILAGLVIDENRADYGRGDFLMRGLLGASEETGAIAVGAPVRVGQTLRFHMRDAASADDDLRHALERGLEGRRPAGALLFTCSGRGSHMFAEPDHDARLVSEALGGRALAGFFCGGEIGPVGGKSFLHGFTATIAVFLER